MPPEISRSGFGIRSVSAIGCRPEQVLINFSHSHAAPAPYFAYKLGSAHESLDHLAAERAYYDQLLTMFAEVARTASSRSVRAVVTGGTGYTPGIAVNRRERTADGRTILGWNPDGFIDEEVPVIAIEDLEGTAIATILSFGCHPVLLGCRCGDHAYADHKSHFFQVSSDFVGALRLSVEQWRGGTCLFLQGAAGNVLPLETFNDEEGPESAFGRRLGLESVHAIADRPAVVTNIERLRDDYLALVDFSLYRKRPAKEQPDAVLASISKKISLPLQEAPDLDALKDEAATRESQLAEHMAHGPRSGMFVNQQRYHLAWLHRTIQTIETGEVARAVDGEVWAGRVGNFAIAAASGEVFSETGYAVRHHSPAQVTLFAGYSNGVLGYIPTPEEYPYGGYEPAIAHRGYGQPAAFHPSAAGIVQDEAVKALEALFAS